MLDEQALARLRELDPSGAARLLERVFAAFETSADRLLAKLGEARSAGDMGGIHYVAHTLKSSSANIGALRLTGHCERIEDMVKSNSHEGLAERLDALVGEARRVTAHLKCQRNGSS